MIDICMVRFSKKGGFPYTGGGFKVLRFYAMDIHHITKIVNEIDISDVNYTYAITTSIKHSENDASIQKKRSKNNKKDIYKAC